jgi:hypothetical protein
MELALIFFFSFSRETISIFNLLYRAFPKLNKMYLGRHVRLIQVKSDKPIGLQNP